MLILFDIDATLLLTGGAGVAALEDAGRELHGEAFTSEGVEFSGRLDPLIIADLLRRNGAECSVAAAAAMRRAYRAHLGRRLVDGRRVGALPGVPELLAELRSWAGEIQLGLLTGNFPETGSMKLRACGIEPEWFGVQVWGDGSARELLDGEVGGPSPGCREELMPLALERYRTFAGREIQPGRVVVIGDTPHDVACARAGGDGCRVLAVATGQYHAAALAGAGADHVVADLSDTQGILGWLMATASDGNRGPMPARYWTPRLRGR